jgi:hypothetical protein
MNIFKRLHDRLAPRTSHHPISHCRRLATPNFLGCQMGQTFLRKRNIQERREQRDVLCGINLNGCQSALKLRKLAFDRYFATTKSLATPFGDWV